jgi:hypothetical protein
MSCMATTTHTMVVELSHEVVVSRGNDIFLSSCSLLHIIKNPIWRPMRLLTCTNVLALVLHEANIVPPQKKRLCSYKIKGKKTQNAGEMPPKQVRKNSRPQPSLGTRERNRGKCLL